MKKENGISMIQLVIVIVIILILVTAVLAPSRDSINEGKLTEVYAEMTAVEKAVNEKQLFKSMDSNFDLSPYYSSKVELDDLAGDSYTEKELPLELRVELRKVIQSAGESNFYKIKKTDIAVTDALGLDGLKRDYIVNFNTGDIIVIGGASDGTYRAYLLSQVEKMVEGIEPGTAEISQ